MVAIHEFKGWEGFEWDEGNLLKNWESHRASGAECEEVLFNYPLVAAPDDKHSGSEARFHALGVTDAGRHLYVVFTVRDKNIRIISPRDMSRRERKVFEES